MQFPLTERITEVCSVQGQREGLGENKKALTFQTNLKILSPELNFQANESTKKVPRSLSLTDLALL